jgi:hypothetical protein
MENRDEGGNLPLDEDGICDDYDDVPSYTNPDVTMNAFEETRTPSFKQDYETSIRPIISRVDALIARSMWSERAVATHPPASDAQIGELLQVLRKISPAIGDHLQIDSSNIRKFPEIKKVMDNHTRGSTYIRQYFKRPLVANCDCVACEKGMSCLFSCIKLCCFP